MKYVLFVCNHNAGRSQMARGVLQPPRARGRQRRVGRHAPGAAVWPEVVEVMARGRHRPRRARRPQAAARDAAARRLGGDDGLRRRVPVRADHGRGLGHPRSRRPPIDEVRADPRRHRAARPRARRQASTRSAPTDRASAAPAAAAPRPGRRVRGPRARRRRSAPAPTRSSRAIDDAPFAPTCRRSRIARRASACARETCDRSRACMTESNSPVRVREPRSRRQHEQHGASPSSPTSTPTCLRSRPRSRASTSSASSASTAAATSSATGRIRTRSAR